MFHSLFPLLRMRLKKKGRFCKLQPYLLFFVSFLLFLISLYNYFHYKLKIRVYSVFLINHIFSLNRKHLPQNHRSFLSSALYNLFIVFFFFSSSYCLIFDRFHFTCQIRTDLKLFGINENKNKCIRLLSVNEPLTY